MSQETTRNNEFSATQRATLFRMVTTLFRHCFEWLQHCSNIAALCCAKNRRCESCRVTSPLDVKVLLVISPFLLSLETLFLSLNEMYKGMGNRKGHRLRARQPKYFA